MVMVIKNDVQRIHLHIGTIWYCGAVVLVSAARRRGDDVGTNTEMIRGAIPLTSSREGRGSG